MSSTVPTSSPRGRLARQLCAGLLTAVLATGALSTAATSAAPPTTDPATAGDYAAGWLARQLDASIPMSSFGSPDWGVTLDAAISLAATETGGQQLAAVWSAIETNREVVVAPSGGLDQPGRLARVILLAHAIGESPTAVGSAPGADLVARLLATVTPSGVDEGLFGNPATLSPTYDGAFRQGYSIAALVAVGATVPTASWQWLVDQQCDDGSWMPYRIDDGGTLEPCVYDADRFVGPDTNSTAAAINGLDAAGQGSAALDAAADWFADVQGADGGWGLYPGDASEPSSTALSWQALVHAGLADDPAFQAKSATPLETLLSFQLGCTSPEDERGALTYPGSNDAPNTFSTAQAVPALAGVALEFGPVDAADTVAVVDCSTPTTTTTTTTSVPPTTTSTVPGGGSTPTPNATAANSAATNGASTNTAPRPISFVG